MRYNKLHSSYLYFTSTHTHCFDFLVSFTELIFKIFKNKKDNILAVFWMGFFCCSGRRILFSVKWVFYCMNSSNCIIIVEHCLLCIHQSLSYLHIIKIPSVSTYLVFLLLLLLKTNCLPTPEIFSSFSRETWFKIQPRDFFFTLPSKEEDDGSGNYLLQTSLGATQTLIW